MPNLVLIFLIITLDTVAGTKAGESRKAATSAGKDAATGANKEATTDVGAAQGSKQPNHTTIETVLVPVEYVVSKIGSDGFSHIDTVEAKMRVNKKITIRDLWVEIIQRWGRTRSAWLNIPETKGKKKEFYDIDSDNYFEYKDELDNNKKVELCEGSSIRLNWN